MSNVKSLLRVFSDAADIASKEASVMFSKWLRVPAKINFENVELQPVEHIAKHSQNQDGGAVGLYMNLEGGLSGGFLFLIPDDAAKQIVAWLMRKSDPSSIVFDDLSYSALKETANIIGSAFLNSLTRQLDCQIFPSSPFILHDIAGSILDSLLAERAATESQSLMIEVSFISTESSFAWGMYFMPEWQPMEQILEGIAHG